MIHDRKRHECLLISITINNNQNDWQKANYWGALFQCENSKGSFRIDKVIDCSVVRTHTYDDRPVNVSTHWLEPIPLTPEWFENLGFELSKKTNFKDGGVEYQFKYEYTVIVFEDGKANIISDEEQSASPTFQYVHELQLLFAAFGIYLTLKPENNG